jgi:hypothetical protein
MANQNGTGGKVRHRAAKPGFVAASMAPALDVIRSLGKARAEIIETLGVLGEARTIDISAVLRTDPHEPSQSGQMMQALLSRGLAERIEPTHGKQSRYRLTDMGRQTAAHIARMRPPPLREHLEVKISAYHLRRIVSRTKNVVRRRLLTSSTEERAGVQDPAQAGILRALEAGPLPAIEVMPTARDGGSSEFPTA